MADVVIYNLETDKRPEEIDQMSPYKMVKWKPTIKQFYPEFLPAKYITYWLFHFFGIFKNNYYSSYLLYENNRVVSALLCVPAYYRWSFMGADDVQLTYVITTPSYRGKGAAKLLVNKVLNIMKRDGIKKVWYVTDTSNKASIKLCKGTGFHFVGNGVHQKTFGGLIKKLHLDLNHLPQSV